jgi:hypothetical protein
MFLAFCLTREYLTRSAFMPELKFSLSRVFNNVFFNGRLTTSETGAYGFEHNHHFGFEAAA